MSHMNSEPAAVEQRPGEVPVGQFDYEVVSAEMERLWPQLFGPELHVPLKVGITDDLHADAQANGSTLSKRKIRLFLGRYCNHPEYLRQLAEGKPRCDINGLPIDEEIPARHIKNATRRLSRQKGRDGAGNA